MTCKFIASDGKRKRTAESLAEYEKWLADAPAREARKAERKRNASRKRRQAGGRKAVRNSAWHQAKKAERRKRMPAIWQRAYRKRNEFADIYASCHIKKRVPPKLRVYREKRLARLYLKHAREDETVEAFLARLDAHRSRRKPPGVPTWFLCPPNLLDTTGGQGLSTYARIPEHQRFRRIDRPFGTLPEFDKHGGRRCVAVHWSGHRCTLYKRGSVFCSFHGQPHILKHMNLPSTQYTIRNGKLKHVLERHLNDPNVRDLKGEVAIVRTMLGIQIEQMDDLKNLGDISLPQMGQILTTTKLLSEMVEKMVNIESKMQSKLSVEQLNEIIARLFDAIVRICAPTQEQCEKLAAEVGGIQVLRDAAIAPSYGDDVVHGVENSNQLMEYKRDGTFNRDALNPMDSIRRNHVTTQVQKAKAAGHDADDQINLASGPIPLPSWYIKQMGLKPGAKGVPEWVEVSAAEPEKVTEDLFA